MNAFNLILKKNIFVTYMGSCTAIFLKIFFSIYMIYVKIVVTDRINISDED